MNQRSLIQASLALVWTLAVPLELNASPSMPPAKLDKPAPDWTLPDVDGKPVKLSNFSGKVVILNFWATWCPPCTEEIPTLVEIQKEYGGKGVVVVGVSVDDGGVAIVRSFLNQNRLNYPVVLASRLVTDIYDSTGAIPTTYLIDRNGKVAHVQLGEIDKAHLEKQLKRLL
jgi:cytochrome c biogenesis protein CcmG/thiol:disulfide interchange protein DsbE